MRDATKQRLHALVERNTAAHGFHVWSVKGSIVPRFAYTVGLGRSRGFELVFAGGAWFRADAVGRVIDAFARLDCRADTIREVQDGTFSLRSVARPWTTSLLLGIPRHYASASLPPVLQIVPTGSQLTREVPDMSLHGPARDAIWRWHTEPWTDAVPGDGIVASDFPFLRGVAATSLVRVDEAEWHVATNDPASPADRRVVVSSIATAIGIDPSLRVALSMDVGDELARRSSRWRKVS